MKSIFIKLFIIFGIVHFTTAATAAENERYNPPFQVVTSDFPPFSYLDEKNQPAGIMTEIMQALLGELAQDQQKPALNNIIIEYMPWKRAFLTTTETKNVLLYPAGKTPDREAILDWVGPRLPRNIWIYALKGPKKQKLKATDFKGQSIGVIRDYAWVKDIRALEAIPEEVADNKLAIRKVIAGRIKYMATEELLLKHTLKQMSKDEPDILKTPFEKVYPLALDNYRTFAIAKHSNADLLRRLNSAYKKIEKKGVVKKILDKYSKE